MDAMLAASMVYSLADTMVPRSAVSLAALKDHQMVGG